MAESGSGGVEESELSELIREELRPYEKSPEPNDEARDAASDPSMDKTDLIVLVCKPNVDR
jgi:hypothetical protein